LKHYQVSFQNYRSRITSATIMKPCGRHGGYKVARRWVSLQRDARGIGGRADAFGCQSTGTPQGRQNFLLLLHSTWKKNIRISWRVINVFSFPFCVHILILHSFATVSSESSSIVNKTDNLVAD